MLIFYVLYQNSKFSRIFPNLNTVCSAAFITSWWSRWWIILFLWNQGPVCCFLLHVDLHCNPCCHSRIHPWCMLWVLLWVWKICLFFLPIDADHKRNSWLLVHVTGLFIIICSLVVWSSDFTGFNRPALAFFSQDLVSRLLAPWGAVNEAICTNKHR